jgi:hypothetical protein
MKEFAQQVQAELSACPLNRWAEVFVKRRLEFAGRFNNGLIFSTSHGADFFDNVVNCIDGAEWEEKGELGNNFRKLVDMGRKSVKV